MYWLMIVIKDTYYSNNTIFSINYLTGIKTSRFLAFFAGLHGSNRLHKNFLSLIDNVKRLHLIGK